MGNKVIGTTSVKLGIYEQSNDSQLAGMLGDKKEFEDGRRFRLCKNGSVTELDPGILVQSIVSLEADDSLNVAAASAAGAKTVTVDVVSNAEHAVHTLRDGYLVGAAISGDIGTFYKIKDNEVMTSGSEATITLYDALTNAFAANSTQVSICVNPYSGVIIDGNTAPLIGVPLITVTASYYFWALVKGYGPGIDNDVGLSNGDYLSHTAGKVVVHPAGVEAPIGIAVTDAASGEALIVKYFGIE